MKVIKLMIAFLVGTGVGVIGGLLAAPSEGKKTRKKVADEINNTKNKLEKSANEKLEEAKRLINNSVSTQAERSKNVIDKAKELITVG